MPRPVLYVFGFASPYAALADWRVDELIAAAGGALEPLPVVPPPTDPPQGLAAQLREFRLAHMREDCARWARRLGMPWKPPEGLPDTTAASAGWHFARERGAERGYRNAVFRARHCEGRDIGDAEVLGDCAKAAGLDRGAFLRALRDRSFHDRVPGAIARCLENRVFGVPFFVVGEHRFWGNDRLDFVVEALREGQAVRA